MVISAYRQRLSDSVLHDRQIYGNHGADMIQNEQGMMKGVTLFTRPSFSSGWRRRPSRCRYDRPQIDNQKLRGVRLVWSG